MNFRKLGNSNLKVSTICLGTMTWAEQNNQKEAFEQINYALDNGINFIDTAEIYPSPCFEKTYGSTEKIIGNWFKEKKNREQVILASKISGPGLSWIRNGGLQYSEQNIKKAIEDSLKSCKRINIRPFGKREHVTRSYYKWQAEYYSGVGGIHRRVPRN